MMNLGSLFSRHARYRPDHLAVIFEDQRLTWLEFNRQINRLANALVDLGIQKGDKVATILPNCLELLEIYWAIAKIGAVVVPASTLLLEQAMRTLLQDSDSVALITNSQFVETIDGIKPELPAIAEDRYILTDLADHAGYLDYHALMSASHDQEPEGVVIYPDEPPVCPRELCIPIISAACTPIHLRRLFA
jgi:acyl-CoA synthetase (AMP-forming)/AMP-acid ligase II